MKTVSTQRRNTMENNSEPRKKTI